MEREVGALVNNWRRIHRQYEGRTYSFFESGDAVCVCGGIGPKLPVAQLKLPSLYIIPNLFFQ